MTYEVTMTETLVKYIICHDVDIELAFKVGVEPIGAFVCIYVIRENYLDSVCTTIQVICKTTTKVQVTLT